MYVCIYVCSIVASKLFIWFSWIWCQLIHYYNPGDIGYILTDFNYTRSWFYLVNHDFNQFHPFFTSVTWLRLGNWSIVFSQNFQCRVFPWFICFEVPWVQNSSFWKLVCAYVCVGVYVWVTARWIFSTVYLQN